MGPERLVLIGRHTGAGHPAPIAVRVLDLSRAYHRSFILIVTKMTGDGRLRFRPGSVPLSEGVERPWRLIPTSRFEHRCRRRGDARRITRGWIEIYSFSWGASNPDHRRLRLRQVCRRARSRSRASTHEEDRDSSAPLFAACCAGQHYATATVEMSKATGTTGKQQVFLQVRVH